jgi:hypothetical protein
VVKLWVMMLVLALTSLATKTFDLVLYLRPTLSDEGLGEAEV